MRLTEQEADVIRTAVKTAFGSTARLWLFGSRADDTKRGGDIDLYIEAEGLTAEKAVQAKLALTQSLRRLLGDQQIDVVVRRDKLAKELPIFKVAREKGVRLQ